MATNRVLSMNIPIRQLEKIDEVSQKHRVNRSETIRQLLDVGLFVESKMGLVESWTSDDIANVKEQFEQGQFVDWLKHMDHKKFQTMMHVFDDERKARLRP